MTIKLEEDYVMTDPEIMSGVPVLKGTRFPIAQILAELANDYSISEIAEDFNLDENKITGFLNNLAEEFNKNP